MNNLKKQFMIKKLLILVLFFALLLALTNFFYIRKLDTITELSSSIVHSEIRFIKNLNDIREYFYTAMRHIKKFFLTNDKDYFGFYKENYKKIRENVLKWEKKFFFSLQEKKLVEEMLNNIERLNEFILNAVAKEENPEKILKKISGFSDAVALKIRMLKDEKEEVIYKKAKSVKRGGESARKIGFFISITTIIISLALAGVFIYTLIQSLKSLIKGTEEISKGNFSFKIPPLKDDEMRRLAKAFNEMGWKLGSLDKMKNDFLSAVSHELRTPLTSMKEAIKLISDEIGGKVTEEQKKLLKIALNSNERMINLVNNLLELSKIRAGMIPFNIEYGEIDSVIKQCVDEAKLIAEKKSVCVQFDADSSISLIPFDKDRISQMLSTLLTNAVKFTNPNGSVKIKRGLENDSLFIEIADSGVGMSAEKLKSIFNENLKDAQHGYSPGSGLGLNIAKEVVKAHNGILKIESLEGVGTKVTVKLPLRKK